MTRTILVVPNYSVYTQSQGGRNFIATRQNEMAMNLELASLYDAVAIATYDLGPLRTVAGLTVLECSASFDHVCLGSWGRYIGTLRKTLLHLRSTLRLVERSRQYTDVYIYIPSTYGTLFAFMLAVLGRRYALYARGGLHSQGAITKWLYNFACRRAAFVYCTGEGIRAQIAGSGASTLLVSPMMPYRSKDMPASFTEFTDVIKLLFVGTISEAKGVYDLLELGRELAELGVTFQISIVGKGDEDEERKLRDTITAFKLGERVHIVGAVNDVERLKALYCEHHLFVFPSQYNEGMPRVFYESMLFGLCIVTYERDIYRHSLADDRNCVLLPAGDIRHMALRIRDIRGEPDRLHRLRAEAQETAKNYLDQFGTLTHAQQIAERFRATYPIG